MEPLDGSLMAKVWIMVMKAVLAMNETWMDGLWLDD